MNYLSNQNKSKIQNVLLVIILAITSIYLGLLISLHFIWYPQWSFINPTNIDFDFNQPVERAVLFFKPLVALLIICGVIFLGISLKKKGRLLPIILFVFIVAFVFISIKYILPLNVELKNTVDSTVIKEKLLNWMKYNDYRMYIIICLWLTTIGILLINRR